MKQSLFASPGASISGGKFLIYYVRKKLGRQDCELIAFNFRLQKQALTSLVLCVKINLLKRKRKLLSIIQCLPYASYTTHKLANRQSGIGCMQQLGDKRNQNCNSSALQSTHGICEEQATFSCQLTAALDIRFRSKQKVNKNSC
ncbi:hypothetical protein D917_07945 [Trichinella nativa]|uniref:Uncharacterized protein n=1 Tax=Trichinella nativa TaxID=6335 RepID=A0A1Y3EN16_9BILA|nr:hypothetical protein D917_07945 [Trichinella nativa]